MSGAYEAHGLVLQLVCYESNRPFISMSCLSERSILAPPSSRGLSSLAFRGPENPVRRNGATPAKSGRARRRATSSRWCREPVATSMRPGCQRFEPVLAVSGTNSVSAASSKIAAATARRKSTSRPLQSVIGVRRGKSVDAFAYPTDDVAALFDGVECLRPMRATPPRCVPTPAAIPARPMRARSRSSSSPVLLGGGFLEADV